MKVAWCLLAGLLLLVFVHPGVRAQYGRLPWICAATFQHDLREALPETNASVERCSYSSTGEEICFVKHLTDGRYRTDPVYWDCQPHPPDFIRLVVAPTMTNASN